VRLVLRRLAAAAALVWLVASLTFVLVRLAPGDPAALLVPPSATADDAARLRAALGLDRPVAVPPAATLRRSPRKASTSVMRCFRR